MPLTDQVVFTLEKETIPYWNKFLQGYYDASGISSDSFDQAVQVSVGGETSVTDEMRKQGITLSTSVATSTMYTGFNWLDPVVGGGSEKLCDGAKIAPGELRSRWILRSLSRSSPTVAASRRNRRFRPAFSAIATARPASTVCIRLGEWRAVRKSISDAKRLLAEAGYPDGVDAVTHQPLVINLDTTANGVGNKSRLDWLRKQFDKINVQLVVRSTDYNRFQDKIRRGDTQMFYFGWNADYPDPENFLFLSKARRARSPRVARMPPITAIRNMTVCLSR